MLTSNNSNEKSDQMNAVAGQFLNQFKKIKELLRYRDIFLPKERKTKTKTTSVVKHEIDAGEARPKCQSAQRLPKK